MKISSKMERCGLSPMRKFNPYAQKTKERGIKIYHLNIGQPDVETPAPFYQALKDFDEKVVSYAPSGGLPVYVDAVRDYYKRIGVELERGDILPTTGGSEALQMTFATILDDGDEVVIPEPFYPNYHTSVTLAGALPLGMLLAVPVGAFIRMQFEKWLAKKEAPDQEEV